MVWYDVLCNVYPYPGPLPPSVPVQILIPPVQILPPEGSLLHRSVMSPQPHLTLVSGGHDVTSHLNIKGVYIEFRN